MIVLITNIALLAVPEAVLYHNELRRRLTRQSKFCVTPRCPRGSLVLYKSKENQIQPALALQGQVLGRLAPLSFPCCGQTVILASGW